MLTSFICNSLLVITKGVVGVMANSHALVADAVHSLSDVIAFFINYHSCESCKILAETDKRRISKQIRRKILEKEMRSTHLSSITYLAFGITVCICNFRILILGDTTPPESTALVVAFIASGVYALIYQYSKATLKNDKKYCSITSQNAHLLNKMNLFAGATVAIGLIGAEIGFPVMDALAGVVVGALMISIGINFFQEWSEYLREQGKDFRKPMMGEVIAK